MNESLLRTIAQLQEFLDATLQVQFTAHGGDGDSQRYQHISAVLARFEYPSAPSPALWCTATLFAAPCPTKNATGEHVHQMYQTKKVAADGPSRYGNLHAEMRLGRKLRQKSDQSH